MKKILALLSLLFVFSVHGADRVYLLITLTNTPANGNTLVYNGSTRTWTNSVVTPASQVLIGGTMQASTTNLYLHLAATPFSGPTVLQWVATNQVRVIGAVGQAVTASLTGTWGYLTQTTNTVTTLYNFRVPLAGVANIERTNVATLAVQGIGSYSQVAIDQTSTAVSSLVGTTNTQTISGQKTFSGSTFFSAPTTTNLVNYGNAISSPGLVAYSEQFGTGASATNTDSLAVGRATVSTGVGSTAIGNGSFASGDLSLSIGGEASGVGSIQIGAQSEVTGANSVILGRASTESGTNSVVIGRGIAGTASNEIILGTTAHAVTISGVVDAGAITNTTYHGTVGLINSGVWNAGSTTNLTATNTTLKSTTTLTGITKLTRTDYTSLATGNNAGVDFGTATYVKIDAGPGGAFTINGIAGGTDGRLLILDNRVAQNMTIAHDSGVDATPANRIYNPTGADMSTTTYGVVQLLYDSEDSRWHLISLQD